MAEKETKQETRQDDTLARLVASMELIAARQSAPASQDAELMATLTAAMNRIAEAQIAGSQQIALETKRAHRPSNEVVPMRSVYNFRGERDHPKPKLKCRMLIPFLVEEDMSTREEIELLNLLESGDYVVRRHDGTKIKVTVRVSLDYNDKPSALLMNHDTAFGNDQKGLMPELTDWLRQVLKQHKPAVKAAAAAVLTMDEEEAIAEAGLVAHDPAVVSL